MTGQTIWLDGKIEPISSAKCSLLSHSLHYGSAFFEGLRFYETSYGPAAFRLQEHIDRFFHSAQAIGFALPFSQEEIFAAVIDLVQINQLPQGYIRLIGFFGEGDMELHPTKAALHTAIFLWPWSPRMGTSCIRVKISSFMRTPPSSTIITAKLSGHYGNSILARQEARKEGYHEALLLDSSGNIAEGPGANFFAMKDGTLLTPPDTHLFPGITRDSVLQIAEHVHIPYRIDNIHPIELSSCDEAFFTGTAMEIISIESIDATPLKASMGPVATQLKSHYAEIVHGKNSHFHHWLTFISQTHQ
jgi:branched-chain amino acid aminotransferase